MTSFFEQSTGIVTVKIKDRAHEDAVSWQVDAKDVYQIKNRQVRRIAKMVAKDGITRNTGIWEISKS